MLLAPYYVLWACLALFMAGLVLALAWLVAHAPVAALVRRLRYADGAAALLAYGALWHVLSAQALPELWPGTALLGGTAVLYAMLRVLPLPLSLPRRESLLFGLVLVVGGASLGAGWSYTRLLADDVALWERGALPAGIPGRPLAEAPPLPEVLPAALRRASLLTRLPEEVREATGRLHRELDAAQAPSLSERAAFRLQIAPVLATAAQRDLTKLRTYLALEAALFAVLLGLWAFGRPLPELGDGT